MGLTNNLDQRVPVLDAWMSIPVRMLVLPTPTGSGSSPIMTDLAGYSISCIPSQQLRGVTSSIAKGRNIYAQLILLIKESLAAQGYTTATPRIKVVKDARDKWQVAIGIADTAMTSLFVRMPADMDFDRQRWANPRWLGFEETWGGASGILFAPNPAMGMGLWAVTKYGTISAWQPEHMGWTTESDRQVEYRVAKSPYDPRAESRLFWGVSDTKRLEISMVHAADVFRDRNADIPCEGWAAAAHTKEFHGNTIERILPWWSSAKPQRFPAMLNPAGAKSLWHRDGAEEDPPPWDPMTLGPLGWWDHLDASTLFVDAAGTVPATAVGDPIGQWRNKGTAGNATQTVSANRAILRPDGVEFGPSTVSLITDIISTALPVEMWVVATKSSSSDYANMVGNRTAGSGTDGACIYMFNTNSTNAQVRDGATGTPQTIAGNTTSLVPKQIIRAEFSQSEVAVTGNGSRVSTPVVPAMSANMPGSAFRLGTGGTSNWIAHEIFYFDRALTSADASQLRAYLEAKHGI